MRWQSCTTNGLNWDHAQVIEWTRILSYMYLRHRAGPIILNDAQNFVKMVLYHVSEYSSLSQVSMAVLLVSLWYLLMSCSYIPIEVLNITSMFIPYILFLVNDILDIFMITGAKLTQASKFNDPDDPCKVLISTDAIGMGLNLNIRRIIFYKLQKMG